jgi:hypothetical protein
LTDRDFFWQAGFWQAGFWQAGFWQAGARGDRDHDRA